VIAASTLRRILPSLPLIRVDGSFWRTVKNAYLQVPPPGASPGSPPQPLWAGGAPRTGARYTPIGGSDALYLAPDAATALAEVQAVLFGAGGAVQPGAAHDPLLVFTVEVRLTAVLDLCDPAVQQALGTSVNELAAPWLRAQERHRTGKGPLPPTQELGDAAGAAGTILALRYPSYRREGAGNLVVFTDHLTSLGGRLVLVDSSGTHLQSLP
jgi:RES domain-containing protein